VVSIARVARERRKDIATTISKLSETSGLILSSGEKNSNLGKCG